MQIEVKKKVTKTVEEIVTLNLVAYWVVRIVRIGGYNNKEVVQEYEFKYEPKEQEITSCLAEHHTKQVFASVVKNYRFDERGVEA